MTNKSRTHDLPIHVSIPFPLQVVIVLWLITVLTVFVNVFFIFLVKRSRLGITHYWFAVSMAIADLCVGIGFFPSLFACQQLGGCDWRFKLPMYSALFNTSIATAMVLIVDRYIYIVFPFRYGRLINTRRELLMIAFSWILPMFLSLLPLAIGSKDAEEGYFIFLHFTFEAAPFVFLLFVIVHVTYIVRSHRQEIKKQMVVLARLSVERYSHARINTEFVEDEQSLRSSVETSQPTEMLDKDLKSIQQLSHSIANKRNDTHILKKKAIKEVEDDDNDDSRGVDGDDYTDDGSGNDDDNGDENYDDDGGGGTDYYIDDGGSDDDHDDDNGNYDDDNGVGVGNYDDDNGVGVGNYDDDNGVGVGNYDDDNGVGVGNYDDDNGVGVGNYDDDNDVGVGNYDDNNGVGVGNYDDDNGVGVGNYDGDGGNNNGNGGGKDEDDNDGGGGADSNGDNNHDDDGNGVSDGDGGSGDNDNHRKSDSSAIKSSQTKIVEKMADHLHLEGGNLSKKPSSYMERKKTSLRQPFLFTRGIEDQSSVQMQIRVCNNSNVNKINTTECDPNAVIKTLSNEDVFVDVDFRENNTTQANDNSEKKRGVIAFQKLKLPHPSEHAHECARELTVGERIEGSRGRSRSNTILLLSLLVVFVLCYALALVNVGCSFTSMCKRLRRAGMKLKAATLMMELLNVLINPVLVTMLTKDLRKTAVRVWKNIFPCKK